VKHAIGYTADPIRLVRRDKARFHIRRWGVGGGGVNPLVDGPVGTLNARFIHEPFAMGLRRWFEEYNRFSDRVAMEAAPTLGADGKPVPLTPIPPTSFMPNEYADWRRKPRRLSPLRPFWRFFHVYVRRGGFLDGVIGVHYALLLATFEYWIEV